MGLAQYSVGQGFVYQYHDTTSFPLGGLALRTIYIVRKAIVEMITETATSVWVIKFIGNHVPGCPPKSGGVVIVACLRDDKYIRVF